MARQKGELPLEGPLGGFSFYKHPDDGYLVKGRSSLSPERVKTHEKFQRTRENAKEFKQAIESGKLVRRALSQLIKPIGDGKLSSRMNKVMLELVRSDKVSERGERLAKNGDLQILKDFDFNGNSPLKEVFKAVSSVSINNNKQVLVNVQPFARSAAIVAPVGAKHFSIVSSRIVLDFDKNEYSSDIKESPLYGLLQESFHDFECHHSLPEGGHHLVALGLIFYAAPHEIPKDAISTRKRRNLRPHNGIAPFTGAMKVVWVG